MSLRSIVSFSIDLRTVRKAKFSEFLEIDVMGEDLVMYSSLLAEIRKIIGWLPRLDSSNVEEYIHGLFFRMVNHSSYVTDVLELSKESEIMNKSYLKLENKCESSLGVIKKLSDGLIDERKYIVKNPEYVNFNGEYSYNNINDDYAYNYVSYMYMLLKMNSRMNYYYETMIDYKNREPQEVTHFQLMSCNNIFRKLLHVKRLCVAEAMQFLKNGRKSRDFNLLFFQPRIIELFGKAGFTDDSKVLNVNIYAGMISYETELAEIQFDYKIVK